MTMYIGTSCSEGEEVAENKKDKQVYDKRFATIDSLRQRHTTCSTVHSFKTLKCHHGCIYTESNTFPSLK